MDTNDNDIVILALKGSQFVIKVTSALDFLEARYHIRYVNPEKMKTTLPPPHTVPVMEFNGEVVAESGPILRFLNDKFAREDLYPEVKSNDNFRDVAEFESWNADVLYSWSLYFSWISDEAFDVVFRPLFEKTIARKAPILSKICCCLINVDSIMKGRRSAIRNKAAGILGADAIADDEIALQGMIKALQKVEACFLDDEQQWVMGSEKPCAADFSLYGNLDRIVSTGGDSGLGAGCADVFRQSNTPRLEKWYNRIANRFPTIWKGKEAA